MDRQYHRIHVASGEPQSVPFTDAEQAAFESAVAPVPDVISDRQFAQGLAHRSIITEAEALAWVGNGTLPAAMETFIEGLPATQTFDARMILQGATEFRRSHPMVDVFGAALSFTSAQIDELWIYCSSL